MKPTRLWIGLVFVAIGVFGILDATEVLEWETTIGDWWPVAVIGYGVAGMLTDRRITFWGLAITGVGAAVLIDEQAWEGEGAIWSGLFLLIGAAILFGWFGGREDAGSEDAGSEDAGFWDWCAGWFGNHDEEPAEGPRPEAPTSKSRDQVLHDGEAPQGGDRHEIPA